MLSEKKQELQVAALENGTVIDHIPSERLFTVVSLLGLEHMSNNITIGFNLKSKKLGTKGIIKIADKFFCDEEIKPYRRGGSQCKTEHYPRLRSGGETRSPPARRVARNREMRQPEVHHEQ